MFDVGFFELVTVCIVALLVLGPDKLPGTIRTAGLWIGRLKRSFNNIKSEIEKEVGADDIRRQLRNEEIMEKIRNTQKQFTSTVDSVKKEVSDSVKPAGMDELKKDFDSVTGRGAAASPQAAANPGGDAPTPESSQGSEPATGKEAPRASGDAKPDSTT